MSNPAKRLQEMMHLRLAALVATWLACVTPLGAQTVETLTTNSISEAFGVAVHPGTNIYYFTSSANNRLLQYFPSTKQVRILAGEGMGLSSPQGVVFARGGLAVASYRNHSIFLVSTEGDVTLLAGGVRGNKDGIGAAAQFDSPSGIASDAAGNLYVADLKNSAIRKIDTENRVTTLPITGLFEPAGIAVDGEGRVFIADTRNHVIRLWQGAGDARIIAGRLGASSAGSSADNLLNGPRGLAWIGGKTGLLVADSGNHTVRILRPSGSGWSFEALAGGHGVAALVDGEHTVARFNAPVGLARDFDGNILVADLYNSAVRLLKRSSIQTFAVEPNSGSFSNTLTVTFKNEVPNAQYYYTLDGTDPSFGSSITAGSLQFDKGPVTLKVRAVSPDFASSTTISNFYTFFVNPLDTAAAGGTYQNEVDLSVKTQTELASIRFTLDGTLPTTNSPVWTDRWHSTAGPLQWRAFRNGFAPSPVVSNRFEFAVGELAIIPAGLSTNNPVLVSISTVTTNAEIRWTIDGSSPTATSLLYAGEFILGTNGTLRAAAFRNGFRTTPIAAQVFQLKVADVVVEPSSANSDNLVELTMASQTEGAIIVWTINGSAPTLENGNRYTKPFSIGTNGTLRVRAFKNGFLPSETFTSSIALKVGRPNVRPGSLSGNNAVPITITSSTTNASIHWTLNGGVPTTSSPKYTGPFDLTTNGVLQVKAFLDGFVESETVTETYDLQVASPVIAPAGANSANDVTITLSTVTRDATLVWSIDGTEPSLARGIRYAGVPFALGTNGVLQVRAFRNGFKESTIVSNTFNLTVDVPRILPGGLTTNNAVSVVLTNRTRGSDIFWTIDGSEPTELNGTKYTGPFLLGTNGVLQAKAFRQGYVESSVAFASFNLNVDPIRILPGGLTTNGPVSVTLTNRTRDTRIYWTIDGSEPTPLNGVLYTGQPFLLATNGLLQARGYRDGFIETPVVSAAFNLNVDPIRIIPGGLTTNAPVSVTLTNRTRDSRFYWTIDGSEPTPLNGVLYTGQPFMLATNGLLQARGYRDGFIETPIVSATFNLNVANPTILPAGANTNNNVRVTLASRTPDAQIFWTIDGTEPGKSNGILYTGVPFDLGTNGVLMARAFRNGFVDSAVVSNTFGLTVTATRIVPANATTNNAPEVTITTTTVGAQIYWTIDGTEPSASNGTLYTGKFALGTNGTLQAKAIKSGYVDSAISSGTFNLTVTNPRIVPGGISTNNPVEVQLSTTTSPAELYWTIDGSEPTPETGIRYTGSPFRLGTNGILQVRAFRNGFVASQSVSNIFNLTAAAPRIKPSGSTNNNSVVVDLSSETANSEIYWTIDGTEPGPSNGVRYLGQAFELGTNGVLMARTFKDGFVPSTISSNVFLLTVDAPSISPNGATNQNGVVVALSSKTDKSSIFWTIDGSDPSPSNGVPYAGRAFELGTNGLLKVRAFRDGFVSSTISSNIFALTTASPVVEPASSTNINSLSVTVTTATTNASLFYTLDGSTPTSSSLRYSGAVNIPTNSSFRILAIRSGFETGPMVAREYGIRVDTPRMSPSAGFFPNGQEVTLSVVRSDAVIRYTLDGTDPTEDSTLYTRPIRLDQLSVPGRDVRAVRARAFAPRALPSDIVAGQPIESNAIGIPKDVQAGIGSTPVLPIVVNLQPGRILRSVQFRVEVSPVGTAPNLESGLQGLPIDANDFVPILSPTIDARTGPSLLSVAHYRTGTGSGPATNGMIITAIGTNANFSVRDFGSVALIMVPIPRTAKEGDRYLVRILDPSGTSDAGQGAVPLQALTTKEISIRNLTYRAGDSSPGVWYNAGDFGDGILDNSDVNNAFYASLGIRVPFPTTDAFDSMDVYPPDDESGPGGDGQIRFLDWQLILERSIGRDTNQWLRSWGNGGVRTARRASAGNPPVQGLGRNFAKAAPLNGRGWVRQGLVRSSDIADSKANDTVRIPVHVRVAALRPLEGLQLKAKVSTSGVSLETPLRFSSAEGARLPSVQFQPSIHELALAWSVQAGALGPETGDGILLGHLEISIPGGAVAGTDYHVSFERVDGAARLDLPYDMESLGSTVSVGPRLERPVRFASDEWHKHYFPNLPGQASSSADPDDDGADNEAEYRMGTDPTDAGSVLAVRALWDSARGVLVVSWPTVPGKSYSLEGLSDLAGGGWEVLKQNMTSNTGWAVVELEESHSRPLFYRVKVESFASR